MFPVYLSPKMATTKFCRDDFLPDGDFAKSQWEQPDKIVFDSSYQPATRYPGARTVVASLWTRTYLYFAFWSQYTKLFICEDEDVAQKRWELWKRDVVEVFINPFPQQQNKYYEFEVAPNNLWLDLQIDLSKQPIYDANWNSHFDHATRVEARRRMWFCEMRVPLKAFNLNDVEAGAEWRVNFYRCDGGARDNDDAPRRFLAWSPTFANTFHVPQRFGLLRFEL